MSVWGWQDGEEEPHTLGLSMLGETSLLQESLGTKSALYWHNAPPCEAICHEVMQPIPRQRKNLAPPAEEGGVQEEVETAKKFAENCEKPPPGETPEREAKDAL